MKKQSAKALCDKIPTENKSYQSRQVLPDYLIATCNLAIGNNLIKWNRTSTR